MTTHEPFAAWLLKQQAHPGWIGELARAAAADPRFPRQGDVKAVYARLNALEADSDMYQAVEDAEAEWLGEAAHAS